MQPLWIPAQWCSINNVSFAHQLYNLLQHRQALRPSLSSPHTSPASGTFPLIVASRHVISFFFKQSLEPCNLRDTIVPQKNIESTVITMSSAHTLPSHQAVSVCLLTSAFAEMRLFSPLATGEPADWCIADSTSRFSDDGII